MKSTGSTSQPLIDISRARGRLAAAAQRNAKMIGSRDVDQAVKGSQWSVGDTAAHLIIALRGFTHSALGDDREWRQWQGRIPDLRTPERIEALNRSMLATEPRLGPADAARAITDGAEAFLAATAALSPEAAIATPWYGEGTTLTVGQATCLLLGEQVLHGYDLATGRDGKRGLSTEDAVLIFGAVQEMLPKMADPITIKGTNAAFEFRLAGAGPSARFVVRVADGGAAVEPSSGQRVDCHILANPVALLLLGYGRISQWQAIGRAKMITWGTKPWLAFRFTSFFSNP